MPERRARRPTAAKRRERGRRLAKRVLDFLRHGKDWRIFYCNLSQKSQVGRLLDYDGDLLGTVFFRPRIILADYRYDVLATVVHECLHALHQYTRELTIQAMERDVMKTMTPDEAVELHMLMAKRLGTAAEFQARLTEMLNEAL